MAVTIGARIQLDGEREYREAMANIAQQQKTLQAELKATQSAYDENTSTQKKQTDAAKVLKQQIALQEEAVKRLKDQIEKSTKATGENSTQTEKLKQQYANATTKLNEMKKSTVDETGAIKDMTSASGENTQTLGSLVEQMGLAAAAVSVLKAGFESLSDTMTHLDDIATQAAQSGLGTDTIQAIEFASDQIDVSADTIVGAMTKMTNAMANSPEKFDELGVAITNADGSMRGTEETFFAVARALSQITNETERDQAAMAIFGKGANELAGIIDDGGQKFQGYAQQARDLGLILSDELINNVTASGDAIATAKSSWDAAKDIWNAQVLEAFAPAIQLVAEGAIELASAFAQLPEPVKVVITSVAAAAAGFAALSKGITALKTIQTVGTLVSGFAGGLGSLGTAATAAGAGLQVAGPAAGTAGAAFTKAAPGMLAFGAAVALVGVGIGAATAGIGYMMEGMSSFGQASEQLATHGSDAAAAVGKINSAMMGGASGIQRFNALMTEGVTAAESYASALSKVANAASGISTSGRVGSGRTLSTAWHANAMNSGMILRGATIFGMAGGRLHGAGEVGSEVVVGASSLAGMISHSVRMAMVPAMAAAGNTTYGGNTINVYSQPGQNVAELADLVADRINYPVQRRLNGRR